MGRKKDIPWKRIKEPTDAMKDHYKKLFERNQSKWMRRSHLENSNLGEAFLFKGREYILQGTVDGKDTMIVSDSENNYYFVHSDIIDTLILGDSSK